MTGLFTPPDEMRAQCCSGLREREQRQKGGTAKSVPFASRVCAGGPVSTQDIAEMLGHMAAIEEAMADRGLADEALSVAWLLWGGDPGREWAESFVMRAQPTVPVLAAPDPDEPIADLAENTPQWMRTLNDLAAAERELLARIHELMEAGVEFAVGRLRSKLVQAMARPGAALRSALNGLAARDALLASMAEAGCAADAVRLVPEAIIARVAPNIETDEQLRAVFAQLSDRLRMLVTEHQLQVIEAVEQGIGAGSPAAAEMRALFRSDLESALVIATDELMAVVARTARNASDIEGGEVPVGRVPASLAFVLLSAAGGGDPNNASRQDYVALGSGETLAAGVALGVTSLRALGRASAGAPLQAVAGTLAISGLKFEIVTVTRWRWGGSQRPFPPHQELNGTVWESESEREVACANPGRFPAVGVLFPGDHRGCSCSYEVQLKMKQVGTAKGTFTPGGEAGAPAAPVVPVGPPPKPMTTVAPAAPPVIPRRGQRQATVVAKVSPGTKKTANTVAKAEQAQAMGEALATLTNAPKRKVDIRVHDLRGPDTPLGYAIRGKPSIVINANKGSTRSPGLPTSYFAGNTTKVTDIEATLIHEWGHTVDIDHEKSNAFFAEITKTGAFPSGYAETSAAELYAESFLDFHVDPETAHPTAKLAAERFGWAVVTPLKDVSALAKRLSKG